MKKFTMWLMVALLAVAPIGCGPGSAGSSGENPGGDGTTVGTDDVEAPADGKKAKSNKDILDEMGPGGPADPDGAAAAAPAPADAKKK